ncbi:MULTISPECIES: fimbria/pilus outer membrane usher protein [Burkholderia]|uniref:fimbria/pilus outer membrane usher protein n=1 Tax=Burkholderia TaxID=32008 RepID=UPI000981F6AC|nr:MULTISPECIES: fimbria/pilus outer membrane usher protein [Burkholderia]AQQ37738.1 fimbrial protein [Burkholderia cenocepacia]MBG0880225.1 fimbrial biogenesis outer membrane usher protein [Burkholderia sp. 9775_39]MBG0886342.1 fimbrial biogenesis outer membrane usher protein [Burkholderia sp. 9773_38]ONV26439.1 fimbrial protein [Burkholderia cenocepacia]ONV35543.1 fimbrial protein [Burkholderia cenocepacia]
MISPIQRSCVDVSSPPRLKPVYALVLSSLAAWSTEGQADALEPAQPAVERIQLAQTDFAQATFDPGFLNNGSGQAVDLSRFSRGNVVQPGTYSVDLVVGSDWIGRYDITFNGAPGTPDAQPCFDEKLLRRIGVDFQKLPPETVAAIAVKGECRRIGQIVPEASVSFDFSEQRLTLSIPQASLVNHARGYVSPDQWDEGVPVGMLDYNLNVYSSKVRDSSADTQAYLGLNGGFNIGNWHFRHQGSATWSQRGGSKYQDISTYVQRDLPSLSSQLVIGETFTSGELFDSTQFRGVRLSTDDRMLPDSLRGYAPIVRGVANSNAKVTIRQNGMTIYETTVSPGAFEIRDLYPTGYGGDLQVSVTEADGSVHSFSVPYAAVPLSLRPGIQRYSFVAGTLRNQQNSSNPLFAQATYQRGLTNLLTGYGGVTVAAGYASAMLGAAFNTELGALGLDFTQATTSIPGLKRFNGSSLRVSYSKSIAPTGTDVSIAAYRYSTSGYFNLNDAMSARDAVRIGYPVDTVWRQRNRASLMLTQRLGEKAGQLSLTAAAANYWNRPGSDVDYSVGYNNSFRNISYSLSATRQRNFGGDMSTLYYASVTIPFGRTRPTTLTSNVTHDTRGRTQVQSMLSGSLGVDNDLAYSVSANHTNGNGDSSTDGNGNLTYRARFAELSLSAGGSSNYQQGSVNIRGAAVAHPGGITLSQPLSETFGIVEAKGAEGARVTNASGVRVDSRGYAIVPFLTPYNLNTVELDPKGISMDVELKETSQQVAPRAGAVPFLKFDTDTGRSAVILARKADGTPLPFGAAVTDEAGKELGLVGQGSKVFVRGLKDHGELVVKWGNDSRSVCRLAYDLPVKASRRKATSYQQITSMCRPGTL